MPKSYGVDTLIESCTVGDPLAWSEFVKRFSHLIFQTIKTKIRKLQAAIPETEIYDIYQHILLSIWQKQKLSNIKNPSSISSWLVKVTQNETVDYLKSKQFPKNKKGAAQITDLASDYTVADEVSKNDLQDKIDAFINSLPLKERRIATLDLLYNLKYEQISEILNLPLGTISSIVRRIKLGLKEYLKGGAI